MSSIVALVGLLILSSCAHARPNQSTCPVGNTISKTFTSGAAWDMCWEVRNEEGIVLSEVYYKPVGKPRRRVLGEAGLSQIQTDYDDGSSSEYLVTDAGLGGANLQTLNSQMCGGGTLHTVGNRAVMCEKSRASGYIYRYRDATRRQGNQLDLFSASRIGTREFIVRWSFFENGSIEPAIGLTGQFSKTTSNNNQGWQTTAQNRITTSFANHYFWRLDFDLASDNGNDIVEQLVSVPSADRLTKIKQSQMVSSELAASFDTENKKFWRVKDQSSRNSANQAISYELVLLDYSQQNMGNTSSAWLKNDVYITQYKACERFAVKNPANNCADNVSAFVNSQNINAKDIVVWYRQVHHTLPRDEDFSPVVAQWRSFILLPRDWTSVNTL